jgi:hypothetical protein
MPGTTFSRGSLINNTYTTFLYPSSSEVTSTYTANSANPGAQGAFQASNCSTTPGTCSATITGLNNNPAVPLNTPNEPYILNILDYYDETKNITINGTDVGGQPVNFFGQSQIDVTGIARYVLKRLQEVVQPNTLPPLPPYAVEGQNICKRFSTYPAATSPDTSIPSLPTSCTTNQFQ